MSDGVLLSGLVAGGIMVAVVLFFVAIILAWSCAELHEDGERIGVIVRLCSLVACIFIVGLCVAGAAMAQARLREIQSMPSEREAEDQ